MSAQRPSRVERREFFLDVVSHLAAEEGLAAVTMERVAALAEVSKPVLYSHFADRGTLLTALLERCWHELDTVVQARLRTARTLEESIEALVRAYFDELGRQGKVLQMMVVSGWHEPAVEAARARRHRSAELQWSAFYQERLRLPRAVADPAAAIMRSALQGAAGYRIEHPDADPEAVISTCLAVIRGGLERLRREQRAPRVAPPAAARRPRRAPARS